MGRLLRKKPVKKKKPEDGPPSEVQSGDNRPVMPSVASGEQQKKNLLQKKPSSAVGRNVYVEKGLQFLREVRAEFRKVTWPSRKQTIGSTLVVIIVVMIISAFLGMVDMGLSSFIRVILQ